MEFVKELVDEVWVFGGIVVVCIFFVVVDDVVYY